MKRQRLAPPAARGSPLPSRVTIFAPQARGAPAVEVVAIPTFSRTRRRTPPTPSTRYRSTAEIGVKSRNHWPVVMAGDPARSQPRELVEVPFDSRRFAIVSEPVLRAARHFLDEDRDAGPADAVPAHFG